jgi:hypothetical protein
MEAFDNNFDDFLLPPLNEHFLHMGMIPQELVKSPTAIGCFELYYSQQVINSII